MISKRVIEALVLSSALTLMGCPSGEAGGGGGAEGPSVCSFDLDCEVGEVCEAGTCVAEGMDDPQPAPQPVPQPENNDPGPEDDPQPVPQPDDNEPDPMPDPEPTPEPEGCVATDEVCDGADNDCDGDIDEGVKNGCGGCAVLDPAPDGDCGVCGTAVCDGLDAVVCEERGSNACGGCSELENLPEAECGECGTYECNGEDAVVCNDPESCGVVRFIAMGDTGEANEDQYRVSRGAQARCDRAGGCEGFIMLGDNIYDEGAQSPTDDQFRTKIDEPYRNLRQGPPLGEGEEDTRPRMPIYVALGNHDLGGAGLNSAQVSNYLEYARNNEWFIYPDEFYDVQVGVVHLVSVHTNPMAYLGLLMDPQGQLVQDVVEQTSASWTIVFGHHPYRSEGRHGNAGSYEGIPGDIVFLGGMFRQWIDEYVCNQVDFYLAGHDHNRQWLASVPDIPTWPLFAPNRVPCRTHFAVSGAGAKTTDFEGRDNELDFGAETEGFLLMEFHRDHAVMEFCDADGNTEWTKTIMR